MVEVDPDTLLEWLQTGHEEVRDMQLIALEQLCTILLLSDNIDRCFESYPPRTFLPPLCKIFLDEAAPDNVLEATARAITYYLDVSQECTRRIVAVDGTIRAICNRLLVIEVDNKTSKDLAEQCIKSLELICSRESAAVFEAGGLTCILPFILDYGKVIFKDSLHSAMSVVTRLCAKVEPNDAELESYVESLSKLLKHEDSFVADGALRCFASLSDRFARKGIDPAPLSKHGLINELIRKLGDITTSTNNIALNLLNNSNSSQSTSNLNTNNSTLNTTNSTAKSQTLTASTSSSSNDNNKSSISISTITGLLSTLCRSSITITDEIIKSNILDSIEKAMNGDERCVLDTMRFLDTLLILIFEGREVLPKLNLLTNLVSSTTNNNNNNQKSKKLDPATDKFHRQIIDWIRNKDTESFIDSLESSSLDINFTDDVGQTLLNWASAFGTPEMVEYLCAKGADVNRGQRSSSLHYAACFGRGKIVKILLRYGANTELRDEEGKTALDKARERGEEGHREVVQILQSPTDYLLSQEYINTNKLDKINDIKTDNIDNDNISENNLNKLISSNNDKNMEMSNDNKKANVIDSQIAEAYIKRLIPIFCKLYLNCMIQSIGKSCLNLLKKLIHYASKEQLNNILITTSNIKNENENGEINNYNYSILCGLLVELLTKVLQDNHNYESSFIGLSISSELLSKCSPYIMDEFTRLGLSSRISQLAVEAGSIQNNEDSDEEIKQLNDTISSKKNDKIKNELKIELKLATQIETGKVYLWNNKWCIIYTKDFAYIWNKYCVLELSHNSNGWFRFMLNGRLYSMYSNGHPETNNNTDDTKNIFIEKLKKAKENIPKTSISDYLFCILPDNDDNLTIRLENWQFKNAINNNELHITNIYANQKTIISKDLNGFQFESNKSEKFKFIAEAELNNDFDIPWLRSEVNEPLSDLTETSVSSKLNVLQQYLANSSMKSNKERQKLLKKSVNKLAIKLHKQYIQESQQKPRNIALKLSNIVNQLNSAHIKHKNHGSDWISDYENGLNELKNILYDGNKGISSYELSISGLVQTLLNSLSSLNDFNKLNERKLLFAKVFNINNISSHSSSLNIEDMAITHLIRKLISLLESIERFPLYLYDPPGSYNLQSMSKRFKLILKKGENETNYLNFDGRILKVEPLANISHLEKYISKMVSKQWFDYERNDFSFLKLLNNTNREFKYESDFDKNGLIYWIGTNGKQNDDWINPSLHGLVEINSSDGKTLPSGQLDDLLNHNIISNCHTSDDVNAWFTLDLGVYIIPTCYSLRHSKGYTKSAPRNWLLQMSRTGCDWDTLYKHLNDKNLNEQGSTSTWNFDLSNFNDVSNGWRYVRIQQIGKNSSDQHSYLSLSGFEIYGKVTSVVYDKLKSINIPKTEFLNETTQNSLGEKRKIQRRITQTSKINLQKQMIIGTRVVRGSDWRWQNQDGGVGNEGIVIGELKNGWIEIIWDNGNFNVYRMGAEGKYDLQISPNNDINKLTANTEMALQKIADSSINNKQTQLNNKQSSSSRNEAFDSSSSLMGSMTLARLFSEHLNINNKRPTLYERTLSVNNSSVATNNAVNNDNNNDDNNNDNNNNNNNNDSLQSKLNIFKNRKSSSTPVLTDNFYNIRKNNSPINENKIDNNKNDDSSNNTINQKNETNINEIVNKNESNLFDKQAESTNSINSSSRTTVSEVSSINEESNKNNLFSAYYSNLTPRQEKIIRHSSLQNTHDKSQSANSLNFFNNKIQETMSEPNALNQLLFDTKSIPILNQKEGSSTDNASSYVPLETTMEELECLETSYDIDLPDSVQENLKEKSHSKENVITSDENKKKSSNENEDEDDQSIIDDLDFKLLLPIDFLNFMKLNPKLHKNAETKKDISDKNSDSNEMTFVNTLMDLAQKKTKLNEAIKIILQTESNQQKESTSNNEKITNLHIPNPFFNSLGNLTGLSNDSLTSIVMNDSLSVLLSEIYGTKSISSNFNNDNDNKKGENSIKLTEKTSNNPADNNNNKDNKTQEGKNNNESETKDDSAVTAILQRCQSSIDNALSRQIDANLLPDIDDEDDVMRDAIGEDNETDENVDDDFMDDEDYASDKMANDNHLTATNDGNLRMRDLKRRHASNRLTQHHQQQRSNNNNQQGTYNDEFVLKCQFSALIPAFDPRPGKTNVNQTQDIVIPQSTGKMNISDNEKDNSSVNNEKNAVPKIELYLKVNKPAVAQTKSDNYANENELMFFEDEIKLTNKNATIFQYIQNLISLGNNSEKNFSTSTLRYEKMKNIWDMSYTIIYREAKPYNVDKEDKISEKAANIDDSFNINNTNTICTVMDVLELLSTLIKMINFEINNINKNDVNNEYLYLNLNALYEEFYSKKITNKLIQQLQDPLVLASRSLPDWCKQLTHSYKFLFPFETRQLYFSTTAFGVSRSIVWLQNKRDTLLANLRGPMSLRALRDDPLHHEFRIGRLKHERVKLLRDPPSNLLSHAVNALKFHATRKAILEIEFENEEGTGLGPTLEFYSLVASELQRKKYALWYCDDNEADNELNDNQKLSINENFIHRVNGLFPIPYDNEYQIKNSERFEHVLDLFHFMGIFVAKSLQDQRLIDMPFSIPFLKILCLYEENNDVVDDSERVNINDNEMYNKQSLVEKDEFTNLFFKQKRHNNLSEILTIEDLTLIDPNRISLIKKMQLLVDKKNRILSDSKIDDQNRFQQISLLEIEFKEAKMKIEDLGLVFQYCPPSHIYGYDGVNLKPNGENIHVNIDNVEEYVNLVINFMSQDGISKQIKAFKSGFDSVFSMDSLKCFEPNELQLLLSGDQAPNWSYEDIMNYTEPKLGYTKESSGFKKFVNVMCDMSSDERKSFVQFLTGCSSLPPGGLANLHPHLTVVRKDGNDNTYPSVNTCVHYLKLPEYSSEEILKKQLIIACKEKGFYLN